MIAIGILIFMVVGIASSDRAIDFVGELVFGKQKV